MNCFNPAYTTSARIVFSRFPDVEYATQSFTLPGINAIYPSIPHQILKLPMSPGGIDYEPLAVNFLVDSALKNYKMLVEWLQTAPTTKSSDTFSQATVFLLDPNKQTVGKVSFQDVMPTSISPIQYQFVTADPVPITAQASFDYTQYVFE